jgi:hypothetical protein
MQQWMHYYDVFSAWMIAQNSFADRAKADVSVCLAVVARQAQRVAEGFG